MEISMIIKTAGGYASSCYYIYQLFFGHHVTPRGFSLTPRDLFRIPLRLNCRSARV